MAPQQWHVRDAYAEVKCTLGEGPIYNPSRNELRFVVSFTQKACSVRMSVDRKVFIFVVQDIWNEKLHTINLDEGPASLRTVDTTVALGVTADIAGTDLLLTGAKDGITLFDSTTGKHEYLAKFWSHDKEKEHRMRFNDGAVDSRGRFWGGTCNDPKVADWSPEGVLFRLDGDKSLHRMIGGATIPNGLGWNDKDDTFFWTDSPTKTIFAFDYNADTGEISNRRPFFVLDNEEAVPDGFAMDVDGCIWSALHGAGKVIRISPEGKVIGEITLPTRCVTCPTFAGSKLFVTSAVEAKPEDFPESVRHGGNLFVADVGIQGQPKHRFKLSDQ